MEPDSLPYTFLIVLLELAIGALWITFATDLRGFAAPSFIKFGSAMAAAFTGLAFWAAAKINVAGEVGGYTLNSEAMHLVRALIAATFALATVYTFFSLRQRRFAGLVAGAAASAAGLAAIAVMAHLLSPPTWGYAAALLSLLVGSLAIGAVTMGMILGHWYLVTPRLPEKPLRELMMFLLAVLTVQALLLVPNLALPARHLPDNALDLALRQNPFFWLRLSGGLAFPWLLALMAWESARGRAMQSATGLLYIAMALVLSGEVVGKGLLFATGVAS